MSEEYVRADDRRGPGGDLHPARSPDESGTDPDPHHQRAECTA